jgi:hypothetical protein
VKQQGFLVGEGRPLRAVAGFRSHINSLLMTERDRRETDGTLAEALGGAQGTADATAGGRAGAARVKKASPK